MSLNFTLQDLVAEGRITVEEVDELEIKLHGVKVPELSKEQMALFILSCDHDLDFTVSTIKEYYKARKGAPELFDDRNVGNEDLAEQLKVGEFNIFPKRTPEGHAIILHRLYDCVPSNYCYKPDLKLLLMTLDAVVFDNPPTGLIIIFDMKGSSVMHLTRMSLGVTRKLCHYLQEGLPTKLHEVHILNVSPFIDKFMLVCRPFLKKKILDKLYFHQPDEDLAETSPAIWKDCMPKDLGGNLPDVATLHSQNAEKLKEMTEYFKSEEEHRHRYYSKVVAL